MHPAQLTRTSILAKASRQTATICCTSVLSVISHLKDITFLDWTPSCFKLSIIPSNLSFWRAANNTLAPSSARALPIDSPIPSLAPVIMHTLLVRVASKLTVDRFVNNRGLRFLGRGLGIEWRSTNRRSQFWTVCSSISGYRQFKEDSNLSVFERR